MVAEAGQEITYGEYRQLSSAEQAKYTVVPFLKSYNVFNVEQTNLDEKCPDKLNALKSQFTVTEVKDDSGMYENGTLDALLEHQTWICPIEYQKPSDGAYYSP